VLLLHTYSPDGVALPVHTGSSDPEDEFDF